MKLKQVFAGALAAAMLVCAVAVPAFAAEEVEQENCLTSSYVQMNIPYADFYKAAGVDNASEIDAVTSATKNKTRAATLPAVPTTSTQMAPTSPAFPSRSRC